MKSAEEADRIRAVVAKHLLPDLTVNHRLTSPVFVIGQARSGTTVLGNLVRKYLKINFGPESQFFLRLLRDLPRYGSLHSDTNFRALVKDIANERCFELNQFGFTVNVEEVVGNADRSYAGAIDYIFRDFAAHNGMVRWGDKTPDYIENLFELDELFPDAQYIHIVRDGRDVALSNFEVFFGANNAVVAALEWQRLMTNTEAFFSQIGSRHIAVRYEDFMEDPISVFDRLIAFLSIDDASGEIRNRLVDGIPRELKKGNYNKWRRKFTDRQNLDFERVAHLALTRKGYEVLNTATTQLTTLEYVYWHFDHLLKKYTKAKVWRDNFYQLRVRLRSKRNLFRY